MATCAPRAALRAHPGLQRGTRHFQLGLDRVAASGTRRPDAPV